MADKKVAVSVPAAVSLERWLGRREAFGMVAGRCSAADAECLREIRTQKLFLDKARNWDEFCRVHLGSSRKKVDTVIGQLDRHGRPFFHVTQMLHLTEPEYEAIKKHMTEDGLQLDGEIIAWSPENVARIVGEVGKLRAIAAPKAVKKEDGVEKLLDRFAALNEQLEKAPVSLDERLRKALGEVLHKLSYLAERRGVVLVQR